jgi:carbamoyltransferase
MNNLGISAYYHDSATALLCDGIIVAAAQEERFSRKKHDSRFPANAGQYCLKEASMALHEVDCAVFYDKPLVKFERLLETYLSYSPKRLRSYIMAMPVWLKEKLFLKQIIKKGIISNRQLQARKASKATFHRASSGVWRVSLFPKPV